MKQRWLQIALGVLLAAVAFALRGRDARPATPEAAVSALFDAARQADDKAYLRLLAPDLRRSFSHIRAQQGADAFRESLRRSMAGVKGQAMARGADPPAGLAAIDVEIVFADRNEQQRVLLAPRGKGWVIESIGEAQAVKPLVPYGTSVTGE